MQKADERLASLDVLRGFDMLFIMGLSILVIACCSALGVPECWVARQMTHPDWLGLRFFDSIFPLFIFIAGVTFPFSMAKSIAKGRTRFQICLTVLRRGVVLFLLGMVYARYFAGAPFRFGTVLGRIGIAWTGAALLTVVLGVRVRVAFALLVLAGYWLLNLTCVAPDNPTADIWTPQGNIVCWFDRAFIARFSRLVPGTDALPFDNQTALSNAMAVVTALLGVFTGEFVRRTAGRVPDGRRVAVLFSAAVVLLAGGLVVAFGCGRWSFPVSKVLWSPSFTLIVGAYSVSMFALFHWFIDVKRWWRKTLFFKVIGMNSIAIYLGQPLLGLGNANKMLFGRMGDIFSAPWNDVVSQLTYIGVCWGVLYFLYRKNVFFKI